MVIRVLIVDDHCIVREGLRMLLACDPNLEVVGEAADGAEAIQRARQLRPNVVVMDLLMPVLDGISATRAIRNELPETQVLVPLSSWRGSQWSRRFERGPLVTYLRISRRRNSTLPSKRRLPGRCTSPPRPPCISWMPSACQSVPNP